MSRFDINDAKDFEALTVGQGAGILNTLNGAFGKKPEEWDILEGSYNGVLFHVFQSKSTYQAALSQITDVGGRRKVKYAFPYTDGQTTDDLGRKPESFAMEILVHGNRYMQGYAALIKEFNKPTPGTLIHPIRGQIKCVVEDIKIVHNHERRKAMLLDVTFIEHNFTVGDIRKGKDKTVKGALARALEAFNSINNAFLQVTGAVQFGQSLVNQIGTAISEYNLRFGTSLSKINSSFNASDSDDIPGLLPSNLGAIGASTSDRFQSASTAVETSGEDTTNAATVLTVEALQKEVNQRRAEIESVILQMESLGNGQGALEFYDEILGLKNSAILMQLALEAGAASSQSNIVQYTVPRLMSIREVAFANGVDVERVGEIDLLNPSLLSVNFIEKDTVMRIPVT